MYPFNTLQDITGMLKICMKKFNDEKYFLINLQHFNLPNFRSMHILSNGV